MTRLVVASGNPGKLRELEAMLRPLGLDPVAQSALGVTEAEEPHETFLENALAKARHACVATGLPALADDSGLCVAALAGEPGVHSAYYGGLEGDRETRDARNNARLVERLDGMSDATALYYCVLVLVRSPGDPCPLVAEGRWHGRIVREPRGAGGFGYDPHFLIPELGITAAELPPERKNAVSHRASALAELARRLGSAP